MAAIKPITIRPTKPESSGFSFLDAIKMLAIVAIVVVCGWMLWAHSEWFRDPQLVKREVVQWGVWGPIIYMLAYAVGPSFLVPGAVMTIAGGLAFGTDGVRCIRSSAPTWARWSHSARGDGSGSRS